MAAATTRSKPRRWRRLLLIYAAGPAFLFALAMLHPYPRQNLFGPKIDGVPWCVWESSIRRSVHHQEFERPLSEKLLLWVGIEPLPMDVNTDTLDDERFLPLLVQLANDRDPAVRYAVLEWLGRLPNLAQEATVEVLRAAFNDPESGNRISAAIGLWRITKDDGAVALLVRELADTSHPRYVAMRQFENICEETPRFAHHLIPLAKDPDPWIRSHAIRHVYLLRKAAVPILIVGLQDEDREVRISAASAAWSLGEDAASAAPALERLLEDSDRKARRTAGLALRKIDPVRFGTLVLEPLER
jgi:hypothetical protein